MTKVSNDKTNKINARNVALEIITSIFEDKAYTNIAIDKYFKNHNNISKIDRAFITRIVEGTVEHVITIDYIINRFSKTKTRKMKKIILYILRLSVYQIKYMDKVPVSAVCNEAVKLAKKRKLSGLSGFVNGVSRNIARNIDSIQYPNENNEPVKYLSIVYSFPMWIIELWLEHYDYETVKVMCINSNKAVKTNIRCNLTKTNKQELKKQLQDSNVDVEEGKLLNYAMKISNYNNIRGLEAFTQGRFTIQDESSMLVAQLADPKENNLVIDVCAAPGGKTTHFAEKMNNTGRVVSRDIYPKKLQLIDENVRRLQLYNVDIEEYNALEIDSSMIDQADIVIADVPCSGLGIIRKKPDIKYNVEKKDIDNLINIQRSILKVVCKYVKTGGILMYSTCTVNPEENIENIKWFIDNFPFELVDFKDNFPNIINNNNKGYIQLLPGFYDTDGFFIAKLKRIGN
ncbi:16S rRNA (cytosine(967)-C(5))-methyltransferase RsmB [Vallitalea sp.]|jgi:16S rRNA (cytosine967-C5)-methyltransferase|uniref:16S rRNA (cytosine(967)-C(5))-methyltransferase RsmB n=1 Tax=Vallitalea sp. TaxID=1882829 RepID=UPI0025E3F71D|nr:16S rRNA (cytosine(967)-C(5))-methyltransferase RsmB [Vallitalea sp.]MCT4687368.1 16S rRNA (cytosine(967)-C(5))-methyltransferase RsmB [Vallitalea sp.]